VTDSTRRLLILIVAWVATLYLMIALAPAAGAAEIPAAAAKYRFALTRAVKQYHPLAPPVARTAAQIHQESSWRPDAESRYASGLAQFRPSTAEWVPEICRGLGHGSALDPWWSIRAVACYDHWLLERYGDDWASDCDAWAGGVLSSYNGGQGNLLNERAMAEDSVRHDRDRWWGHVEMMRDRSKAAWQENRHYPRRILLALTPEYLEAGWPGTDICQHARDAHA